MHNFFFVILSHNPENHQYNEEFDVNGSAKGGSGHR